MPLVISSHSSSVMLCSWPAKSLSSVRNSMQWHSCRAQGQRAGQRDQVRHVRGCGCCCWCGCVGGGVVGQCVEQGSCKVAARCTERPHTLAARGGSRMLRPRCTAPHPRLHSEAASELPPRPGTMLPSLPVRPPKPSPLQARPLSNFPSPRLPHPHLALPHRHAGAVPVALVRLRLLVVVVAAGAERHAQLVLVLRQPLDHHRRHRLVHAEVGAGPGRTGEAQGWWV